MTHWKSTGLSEQWSVPQPIKGPRISERTLIGQTWKPEGDPHCSMLVGDSRPQKQRK